MNTYYTAKDIEELAASGARQLVLIPGVFLTDFARETAHQLGIDLVRNDRQSPPPAAPIFSGNAPIFGDRYNKPSGCQHALTSLPAVHPQAADSSGQRDAAGSNTVNKLIDLMGKVIKRGG